MVELWGKWDTSLYFRSLETQENDQGRTLTMMMRGRNNSGIDVSASGICLLFSRRRNDTTNLISGGSCTIASGLGGYITYVISSGDFVEVGRHQLQASYRSSGTEITCAGLCIVSKADFG